MRGERALNELAKLAWELGFQLDAIRLTAPINDHRGPWTVVSNYETDFGTVWITKDIGL